MRELSFVSPYPYRGIYLGFAQTQPPIGGTRYLLGVKEVGAVGTWISALPQGLNRVALSLLDAANERASAKENRAPKPGAL